MEEQEKTVQLTSDSFSNIKETLTQMNELIVKVTNDISQVGGRKDPYC